MYVGSKTIPGASHLPMWRLDGVILTALIHMGPVEFLCDSSIRRAHILLRAICNPNDNDYYDGTASATCIAGYLTYIDFMNNMGHCNFELIPKWLFTIFPPLKYLMYTPSFHSLHHTQFRTNYSLFMPIYDYIYGTMDTSSDTLYENSLRRPEEAPDVVHLTHLTTPDSIYHLRLGLAHMASTPQKSKWYLWLMWPVTMWTMMLTWIYGALLLLRGIDFTNSDYRHGPYQNTMFK
uniref:Fatty acid hydroxylase domain-containing protein n=1 Tax=Salix viminalis TaxID=40686 RepID=A0A6N2MX48_SALVM